MEMPRNLARLRRGKRLVTEGERADAQFFLHHAAKDTRRHRVVIARDPYTVERARKTGEARGGVSIHAMLCLAVMETVAQRHQCLGLQPCDERFQTANGRPRVIGWKRDAPRGEGRAFFEME